MTATLEAPVSGFWGTHPQCGVPMGSSPKPYPPRCLTYTKHGATSAHDAHWLLAPTARSFTWDRLHLHPVSVLPGTKHGSDLCPPARCSFPREAKGREQGEEQREGGKADLPPACSHPSQTTPPTGSRVWGKANPLRTCKDPDRNFLG